MDAGYVFMVLLLAMPRHSSGLWCICKNGISDTVLQKTLDYACGAGADCNPTHTNGPCFNPNTVRAHCNYAVNSYFQKNRQIPTACDFSGTASVINSDPSVAGCSFPASATSTTPVSTTPTTIVGGSPTTTINGTPSTTTTMPNGGSPLVTSPSNGILGGVNNEMGPSGMNNDEISDGGILLPKSILFILSFFRAIFVVGLKEMEYVIC